VLVVGLDHANNLSMRTEALETVAEALHLLLVIDRGVHSDEYDNLPSLRDKMPHQFAGQGSIHEGIDRNRGETFRAWRIGTHADHGNAAARSLVDVTAKTPRISRRDH